MAKGTPEPNPTTVICQPITSQSPSWEASPPTYLPSCSPLSGDVMLSSANAIWVPSLPSEQALHQEPHCLSERRPRLLGLPHAPSCPQDRAP